VLLTWISRSISVVQGNRKIMRVCRITLFRRSPGVPVYSVV
jgi:hypothetical protein